MIKQISKILYKPSDKLVIKLVVGLLDAKGDQKFYTITNFNSYDYLTLNLSASINIQYKPPASIPWSAQQLLHVTVDNIFAWNFKLKQFYTKVQNPDLYTYYESGRIGYNGNDEYILSIPLKYNEYAEFEPGLIFDEKGKEMPGIFFRINIRDYQVELSFDQFEAMLYMFTTINISQESLTLLNTKLLLMDKVDEFNKIREEENKQLKPKRFSKSIFDKVYERDEEVIDNRPSVTNISSLDELEELK